jgi:ABC-type nickel/cobalt efflux system permease component RcnA
MNVVLAKLMILVYGLSIAGYVLLDSGHEILHTLKSNLHHHEEEHHHNQHDHHDNAAPHHVEDHQSIFTPDIDQSAESKDWVQIFSFLLFFQTPSALFIPGHSADFYGNGLFQKLLTLTRAPLTPPPLA